MLKAAKMNEDTLLSKLKTVAGSDVIRLATVGNEVVFGVPAEKWVAVVTALVEDWGVYHLSAITLQQREESPEEIEVMYHFWDGQGVTFRLAVPVARPELPSIIAIIPGADFYEREAAEMFGIVFKGREETPPLLLPDDWDQGPPFRRKETDD